MPRPIVHNFIDRYRAQSLFTNSRVTRVPRSRVEDRNREHVPQRCQVRSAEGGKRGKKGEKSVL